MYRPHPGDDQRAVGMSFPRYERYKDSGVEWLGEVPVHWELKRLKHCFRLLTEKTNRRENPIALENVESWSGRFIKTETAYEGDGVAFERGDILFGKLRPYLAKAYLTENQGEAIGDFHVLRPMETTYNRFSQYQILNREFIDVVDGSTFGAKMPRVSWDFLGNIILTVPPYEEQSIIANFLDRETTKIDELIAEQQRLIKLLKEKRQAVISHAVTKGLNPDAPMKDSGIEWLGEVPEHWEVVAAKRVASVFVPQRNKPELNNEGKGVFWATMDDMKTEEISQTSLWVSEDAARDAGSRILSKGAVIASCVGNFGIASINSVDLIINQQLQAYVLTPSIKAEFLRYFLFIAKAYFEQVGTAATLIYVNQQGFENLPISLPPVIEQERIISYLVVKTAKLDTLTTEAQRAIELLKERRTALISAAVTGKIDVRSLVSD